MHPMRRPTVVLLHSSAGSSRQWERLVSSLQPRFRVCGIDFHGHGERPAWRGDSPLRLADEAALVAPLLDEDGVHLVGHSYGAAVALKLAAMHPRSVRSVIAYEPVLFRWLLDDDVDRRPAQDIAEVVACMSDRLARGDPEAASRRFVDFWSGDGAWNAMPDGQRQGIVRRIPVVLQHFDALFDEPLAPAQLGRLAMPMSIVSGARTAAVTRRIAALLRTALPHASHEVMEGLAHMGPITHAAQVNDWIVARLYKVAG